MTGSEVPALVPSLSVSVASDSVRFRLDVTNPGTEPVVIEFPTAERADFAVLDAAGAEVWRASADRMFAQVMGADTVAAGGTRSYEAVWSSGARSGAHVAAARLASTSHDVDLRAEFELPAQ